MPMSWAGTPLRKNDMRRVLAGALTALFGTSPAASGITPIAPENVTTPGATLHTYMYPDDTSTTFSDAAATTSATVGGALGALNSRLNLPGKGAQGTAANQPTLVVDPATGKRAARFAAVGTSTIQFLSLNPKGVEDSSGLIIFSGDPAGNSRNNQTILAKPNTSGSGLGLAARAARFAASQSDSAGVQRGYATTNAGAPTSAYLGAVDVMGWRYFSATDTLEVWRGTSKVSSSVGIGGKIALSTTALNLIGALTTTTEGLRGNLIAVCLWSGVPVGDDQWPGVMQWGLNQAAVTMNGGAFLGMFFQGDGAGETGVVKNPVLVQSDDLKIWKYRPSGVLPGNSPTAAGAGGRDYGLAVIGTDILFVHTGSYDTAISKLAFFLHKFNADKVTASVISEIPLDMSAFFTATANSNCWAPTFVKNQDGSTWLDANGSPLVLFVSSVSSATNKIYGIQPVDTTWTSGGAWGTPFLINATFASTEIDPSCVRTSDGVFHMFTAGQGAGAQTYHHTAADPKGSWTSATTDIQGGYEGSWPVLVNGTWRILLDSAPSGAAKVSAGGVSGYYWSDNPSGLNTTGWTTPVLCTTPFYPEHGEFIPRTNALIAAGW